MGYGPAAVCLLTKRELSGKNEHATRDETRPIALAPLADAYVLTSFGNL